eukprot:s864_g7.t1
MSYFCRLRDDFVICLALGFCLACLKPSRAKHVARARADADGVAVSRWEEAVAFPSNSRLGTIQSLTTILSNDLSPENQRIL